jgi:hypothetical protein
VTFGVFDGERVAERQTVVVVDGTTAWKKGVGRE